VPVCGYNSQKVSLALIDVAQRQFDQNSAHVRIEIRAPGKKHLIFLVMAGMAMTYDVKQLAINSRAIKKGGKLS
jgi:hypothetical protein